jgi:hypothetical protein
MPFGEWGPEAFFEYLAKPVIEDTGFQVERLYQTVGAGHIPQMFLERLDRADAVIADLSDYLEGVVRRGMPRWPSDLPISDRPRN